MPENGELRIELAGRPLALKYSFNCLCDLEERTGLPIECLLKRTFMAARLLLWAGLRQDQPELTVRDVGDLIEKSLRAGGSLDDILELCAKGLWAAGLLCREG